jgi:putative phosphoribosyl transferase
MPPKNAMAEIPFHDREDAGRRLGEALERYRGRNPLVLAIPRGGVPIGRIVADMLGGELDVVLVRKLGAPRNPELAIGAIDEQGTVMLNEHAGWLGASGTWLARAGEKAMAVIRARRAQYGGAAIPVRGRTVIVVDDGLATGATMIAALRAVRAHAPGTLVCAVPVAALDSLYEVARHADDVVCLRAPPMFHAVGLHYRDFDQVGDSEVAALLGRQAAGAGATGPAREVRIPAGHVVLAGDLAMPAGARGLVVFAHGSGSSRHSARNRSVASALQARGLATLLFDLLAPAEDAPAARFDITLLAGRLQAAVDWCSGKDGLRTLPLGLFGASTGAAAALRVAAAHPGRVASVVSRGGRPDLAGKEALARIRTPVLLVVGGADREVLALNRAAREAMGAWAELAVVPGATHLFEEPGTLDRAATLAADWFLRHFRDVAPGEVAVVL